MEPLAGLVDWGTSAVRVYSAECPPRLLHTDAAGGVLSVPAGDDAAFAAALERALASAGIVSAGAVVVCGMAGSSRGWREVPYACAPADAAALAAGALTLRSSAAPHRAVVLLPGVRSTCNANAVADVMRGEETQCVGAAAAAAAAGGGGGGPDVLVLPGTHSKWVVVCGGIRAHTTFMTGELFALLSSHSILAGSIAAGAAVPGDAAAAAADAAAFLGGLRQPAPLAALFSVRTRDVLAPAAARPAVRATGAAYLSGALLALELREARAWLAAQGLLHTDAPLPRVHIVGAPALAARYLAALADGAWCAPALAPGDATAAGLALVAAALGYAAGGGA